MPLTKTLVARLAAPTQHKQRKLGTLQQVYQEALDEVFEQDATTRGEANEIVTPYDLPYQVKDALKNYAPTLDDAEELDEEHPVRFVNRAAVFDHDPDREAAFTWQVPQPGHGTNFWIPLRINPDHREDWLQLHGGTAKPGEVRLIEDEIEDAWYVHVTVHLPEDEPDPPDHPTFVGVDVGENLLAMACGQHEGSPVRPRAWSGNRAKNLRHRMHTTLKRLQSKNCADWRFENLFRRLDNQLEDIVEQTSRDIVDYAATFKDPVIVLEDLTGLRDDLDYGSVMNRRLHQWAFSWLQRRIRDKAHEQGIAVVGVNPAYTSQYCHACNHMGTRSKGEFRCQNPHCWVSEYQADLNAAANQANLASPGGETCSLKPGGNDSPGDGSPRDRATTPTKPRRKPQQ